MKKTKINYSKTYCSEKKAMFFLLTGIVLLIVFANNYKAQPVSQAKTKKLCITIDDLPLSSNVNYPINKYREYFLNGLAQIKAAKVPVIGFVNETFLYTNGREEKRRSSLLADWLDAGLELGNHTFSHADANKLSPEKYIEDIKKGEIVTSALLQTRGKKETYFRYPYLKTGLTLENKKAIEDYLSKSGYIIAPATVISLAEMVYAEAYRVLAKNKDTVNQKKAAQEFINLFSERIALSEKQAVNLFKRDITQILILHNTEMCLDNFKKIIEMIHSKGYTIVTLEEALKDEVYQTKDNYVDHGGMDWLSRWAKARGVSNSLFSGKQPEPSDWILKLSNGVQVSY